MPRLAGKPRNDILISYIAPNQVKTGRRLPSGFVLDIGYIAEHFGLGDHIGVQFGFLL